MWGFVFLKKLWMYKSRYKAAANSYSVSWVLLALFFIFFFNANTTTISYFKGLSKKVKTRTSG